MYTEVVVVKGNHNFKTLYFKVCNILLENEDKNVIHEFAQVSKYHRGEMSTVEYARKAFYYRKSISRQVRIFNLVIVNKNLNVQWWKTRARLLQFQTCKPLIKTRILYSSMHHDYTLSLPN